MMSNALWSILSAAPGGGSGTSAPASAPAGEAATGPAGVEQWFASPVILALLAAGICVLVVWIVRRAARPSKLLLRRAPGRPNQLTVIHVIVPLALWLLATDGVMRLAGWMGGVPADPRAQLIGHLVSQAIWLAAALIAAAAGSFRGGLKRGLGLSGRRWLWDGLRALLGYLAVLPPCLGLFLLMSHLVPLEHQHEHTMLEHLRTQSAPWKAVIVLSAVVLAPLAEEVFFRGLVQSMLRRYLRQPWVAILIASAAFTAIHYPYVHTMPTLFVLAIALGYNYERTGRLLAPILIHAMFNAVNILVLLFG